MARSTSLPANVVPMLAHESVYVGIDVGKAKHVAGFVSTTLLQRHERFEGCPVFTFEQSREGFRRLIERIEAYCPLAQCFVLLEKTGHYHLALVQYLLELDISVYLMHVQTRPKAMLKTDKRDALVLANHLYNQLDKGVQFAEKAQLVHRAVPPTEAASQLRSLIRHRYELTHENTQRRNKLTAIADELFPELGHVVKETSASAILAIREHFPTPQALAAASLEAVCARRIDGRHPSAKQLALLQELARTSIGSKDVGRIRGLIVEQRQLIHELRLLQAHTQELETEIRQILAQSREGRIILSIPGIGPIEAAGMIAVIGHIDNFSSAAALKSYFGWAPKVTQSGETIDQTHLTRTGNRLMRHTMFLVVSTAIRLDCEWARSYERLVPLKCSYDERTKQYKGKLKVIGRIAGQMITTVYALLKRDADLVREWPPSKPLPEPQLYDPLVHKAHREGHYQATKPKRLRGTITHLPNT